MVFCAEERKLICASSDLNWHIVVSFRSNLNPCKCLMDIGPPTIFSIRIRSDMIADERNTKQRANDLYLNRNLSP